MNQTMTASSSKHNMPSRHIVTKSARFVAVPVTAFLDLLPPCAAAVVGCVTVKCVALTTAEEGGAIVEVCVLVEGGTV